MAATRTCGAPTKRGGRCSRPLKAGENRCWEHQNVMEDSSGTAGLRTLTREEREVHRRALAALGHEGRRRIIIPKPAAFTPLRMSATMLSEYTPIDPKLAYPLAQASEQLLQIHDYTVPQNVTGQPVLEEMTDLLKGAGVPRSRMSLLRLQGFHRRTPSGKLQHSRDLMHEAIVLDEGLPTETVVDPGIASFAPVHNPALPVPEQLAEWDRNSPLIDVPWVSSLDEYVSGDYLWWDSAKHLDLDQRTKTGR